MKRIAKLLVFVLIISLISIAFVGCGNSGNDSNKKPANSSNANSSTPQYTFRVASNQPEEHPDVQALYKFADELKSRSNGRIELKVYPAAQLGEETEEIEQTQQGSIDFARVSAGNMTPFDPAMDIFSVPYLFNDEQQYLNVLKSDIGKEIMAGLEQKNLKGLVYYNGGSRSFYNRLRPIKTPADMKGMKIRVMPSKVMLSSIQALGATATTTAFGEIYSAVQTGVIDGAENSSINLFDMKHYEVAKYFSRDDHMWIPDMVIMSLDKWNSVPEDIQKIITDSANASLEFQLKAWADKMSKVDQDLKANGAIINDDVDKEAFKAAVKPLVESLKPQFNGLIEKIQATK